MKKDCNLDLCLFTSGSPPATDSGDNFMMDGLIQDQHKQFTIFYNGRVCFCDVTEIQAKALMKFASQQTERKMDTPRSEPVSQTMQSLGYSPPGLSMKRSLQRFLQKRKNRIQATSPYSIT